MSKDLLVPPSTLMLHQPELQRRIDQLDPPLDRARRTGEAGEALANALLFERWPELLTGEALDPERIFYNRYFWFRRFTKLWQVAHGPDAGLEQQAFQILEQAAFNVDWSLIQELDIRAGG